MSPWFDWALVLVSLSLPSFILTVYQVKREREFFEGARPWCIGVCCGSIVVALILFGLGFYWHAVDQEAAKARQSIGQQYGVEVTYINVRAGNLMYVAGNTVCEADWKKSQGEYSILREPAPKCHEIDEDPETFNVEDLPR